MIIKNPLFDKEFLDNLFTKNEREIYARITLLTLEEKPIEFIEGKITDGTISIDGSSAVRRTCNLTMVAENVNINDFYWGLKNKFKLEVGIKNDINPLYPDIIWFKQGIFVITSFNTSQNTKNYTIKIQGKDKMCLLNGDLSGRLPSVDFAVEEYVDKVTGEKIIKYLSIKTIIKKMLQEFAMEPLHNIIINDVDEAGLKILEYNGTEPFYMIKNNVSQEFQMITNTNLNCFYQLKMVLTQAEYNLIPEEYSFLKEIYVRDLNSFVFNEQLAALNFEYRARLTEDGWFRGKISDSFNIVYDDLLDDNEFEGGQQATQIKLIEDGELYTLIKFESGDIPGYIMIDLKWAGGELKSNVGETITSILDKIVRTFYNFEYYYDIDGKFVFQQKREYITTPWNSTENNIEIYQDAGQNQSQTLFTFTDGKLISSFQNTPEFQNIKNDYFVQGQKDNTLLRMRYAIDKKPIEYTPIRPLQEKIYTIIFEADGSISSEIQYQYYDAPEPIQSTGGYDENNLFTFDSYEIINNMLINNKPYLLEDLISLFKDLDYKWQPLFKLKINDEINEYYFIGSPADVKEILLLMHQQTIYDNSIDMTIVKDDNGREVWNIVYPYFSKYPYSVEDYKIKIVATVTNENYKPNKYYLKSEINGSYYLDDSPSLSPFNVYYMDKIVHYKVDWRELIYQMALDYRKLNYTDNYFYYLKQMNPQFIDNKTGYEQYYIDILAGWRELYNPNPSPILDNSISYKDIKQQSYIINHNAIEEKDIYIKNPYRLINRMDSLDNLKYSDIYKYSKAEDQDTTESIYPYFISDKGKLNFNQNYYIKDGEGMTLYNAKNEDDEKYKKLNNTPISDIWLKNTQQFTVPEKKDSSTMLDFKEKNEAYFKVPIYSNRSNLSTYEGEEVPDYINFIENNFKQFLETFDPFANENIYIKDNNYILLSKENAQLWNQYYQSDLSPLSYYSQYIINSLNRVIDNNYESVEYIQSINKILKEYFNYLNETRFKDIQIAFFKIIFKYLEIFKNNLFNKDLLSSVTEETSCAPYLFNTTKNYMDDIFAIISLTNINYEKDYLKLINVMNNFCIYVDKLINDIKGNYDQVKYLLTDNAVKDNAAIDAMDQETMTKYLEDVSSYLNSQNSYYIEGQLQKTKKEINVLLTQTDLNKQKADLKLILKNIEFLSEDTGIIKTIKEILFNQYLYIIFEKDETEKEVQKLNENSDLYKFLLKIKSLHKLFKQTNFNNSDILYSATTLGLNDLQLFSDLYNSLSKNQVNREKVIKDYNEFLKNFQQNIIREDVNNFNYLKDDNIIFEPIEYCQATYSYNSNIKEGNFWSKDIFDNPELLTFWIDFLEPESYEMAKYSVPAIGIRSTALSDTSVNAIHKKDIPLIIFRDKTLTDYDELSGYTYINFTTAFSNLFKYQATRKTAKEKIEELLYTHSYATEKVTVQAVPIYNLEPNNKIYIKDNKCNIDGEYLINKITIPLSYKKLMSITATKSVTDII